MDTKKQADISDTRVADGTHTVPWNIWKILCAVGAGFALGGAELPFNTLPFGIALLCAADTYSVWAYAGACLSLLFVDRPLIMLAAYTLALLIRVCVSLATAREREDSGVLFERVFSEHISLRVVSAAVVGFGVGAYRLVSGGFLYYDLFAALTLMLAAALGCLLLYPLTLERLKDSGIYVISGIALFSGAAWGLRELDIYGISLSVFVCMLATLALVKTRGIMHGSFVALICGLCVSFSYAPLFVFGAVCYGTIGAIFPFLGCLASLGVGLAWGVYIGGFSALTELMAALVAANLLFYAIDKLYLTDTHETKAEADEDDDVEVAGEDYVLMARFDDAMGKIKLLCEGLSGLSDTLASLDEKGDASAHEELISSINVYKNGLSAEIGEIGELCDRVEKYSCEYTSAPMYPCKSAALDFRVISDYLAGVMVENGREYITDSELCGRLADALRKNIGEGFYDVYVFGNAKRRVTLSAQSSEFLKKHERKIRQTVSVTCGFPVAAGEIYEDGALSYITLFHAPVIKASFAGRKRGASDEPCGDSFGIIKPEGEGRAVVFISDGMGSGAQAARASGLCTLFLQKLLPLNLSAGSFTENTVTLLNGFLCAQNQNSVTECSATLDLGIFDLVECKARFYKSGAAPTYIFRDGALYKLRSHTYPMGIIEDADIGMLEMELLPGDTIVMVSDGVTEGREECPELFEYLQSRLMTHSAEQLADSVMKYAEERGSSDDVTALVIKIEEKALSELAA